MSASIVTEWPTLADVMELAQEAQDASLGDSNDTEIDKLREALEAALRLLGTDLPTPAGDGL